MRFNSALLSIWNRDGSNKGSIEAIRETIFSRLGSDVLPTSSNSYFYKKHSEHEGYKEAVEAARARARPAGVETS